MLHRQSKGLSPNGNMENLVGQTFGRITVCRQSGFTPERSAVWLCVCSCGNPLMKTTQVLKSGKVRSCGCLHTEIIREKMTTHGGSNTRLYRIWAGMKNRCYRKDFPKYERWGGRGIRVCGEWHKSFERFRQWAIANGYRKDLTIDRIDNDGDYSPLNCRWSNPTQQANNRRTNRIIEHGGESHTLAQWARRSGLTESTIRFRLDRYGWDVGRTLETKSRIGGNNG